MTKLNDEQKTKEFYGYNKQEASEKLWRWFRDSPDVILVKLNNRFEDGGIVIVATYTEYKEVEK